MGAGVVWDINAKASLSVDYEAEVFRSDFDSHWFSLRVGLKF